MINKLTEHQGLVPIFQHLRQNVREDLKFGAGNGDIRQNKGRIAAESAQPHDLNQDSQMLPILCILVFCQTSQGALPLGLIQGRFFRRHLHLEGDFSLGGQLLENIIFHAPKDKGLNQSLQLTQALPILVPFNGDGEIFGESLMTAKQSGIDEIEQGPQLAQMILQGSSGGNQAKLSLQGHGRLSPFGLTIFNGLGLIQHHHLPRHLCQHLSLHLQQAVTAEEKIKGAKAVQHLLPVSLTIQLDIEGRGKTTRFLGPVIGNG